MNTVPQRVWMYLMFARCTYEDCCAEGMDVHHDHVDLNLRQKVVWDVHVTHCTLLYWLFDGMS